MHSHPPPPQRKLVFTPNGGWITWLCPKSFVWLHIFLFMSHFTESTSGLWQVFRGECETVAERGVEGGATMCPARSFNNLKAPKPEDVRGVSKAIKHLKEVHENFRHRHISASSLSYPWVQLAWQGWHSLLALAYLKMKLLAPCNPSGHFSTQLGPSLKWRHFTHWSGPWEGSTTRGGGG